MLGSVFLPQRFFKWLIGYAVLAYLIIIYIAYYDNTYNNSLQNR